MVDTGVNVKRQLLIITAIFAMLTLLAARTADSQSQSGSSKTGSTPQVRADSDAHWEWREERWPNAEEIELLRRAADNGDAQAQFRLALMYDGGHGVVQDQAQAARWLLRAAQQGLADAQYNLALALEDGRGVEQNDAEAAMWYRAAALQGFVSAQKNLGVKYALGQGVAEDPFESYIWSSIAAQSGDEAAINNAALAANRLTPTQLEKAKQRAALRYRDIQQAQSGG